ncbi:MAG: hypothetical protein KDA29_05405 [Phycisphaerales bacterium]|nr:hypothetical protein [Phycisphaerales bacterium]
MQHDELQTNHLAAYLSGLNASTLDREGDPAVDEDGHVITGTIIRRLEDQGSLAPVRVRIGHGVAAQTAASMLRKMADMLEDRPDFLSQRAGAAVRRLPDGTTQRKQLTIRGMLAAAEEMSPEERAKLHAMLDEIRVQIDDPDKGDDGWGQSKISGPGLD